jgi:hypothetical protein
MNLTKTLTTIAIAGLLAAGTAHAASISWTVHDITGDVADVSTDGTVVQAHAGADMGTGNVVDGTTLTINGVVFDDGFVFDSPSHLDTISGRTGSTVSGVYTDLLKFADRQGSGTATFTYSGLTVGNTYLIQVWHSDTASTAQENGMVLNTGGIVDTPTIGTAGHVTVIRELAEHPDYPTQNTYKGSSGQYAIGTFVADATTQQFLAKAYGNLLTTPTGQSNLTINAAQLRDLGPIPEPASLALLGLGSLMIARRRRA